MKPPEKTVADNYQDYWEFLKSPYSMKIMKPENNVGDNCLLGASEILTSHHIIPNQFPVPVKICSKPIEKN
jgi:hypothetical protein